MEKNVSNQLLSAIETEITALKTQYKKAMEQGKEFEEVKKIVTKIKQLEQQLILLSEGKS